MKVYVRGTKESFIGYCCTENIEEPHFHYKKTTVQRSDHSVRMTELQIQVLGEVRSMLQLRKIIPWR